MSTSVAPIKVDARTDHLITQAAHFLGRSKKDVVDVAVREYVDNHRDDIAAGVREALRHLDGSVASSVALMTGMSPDELHELGGFGDTNV